MKKYLRYSRIYKKMNKEHFDKGMAEREVFFEDIQIIKDNCKRIINNEKDYEYELIRLKHKIEDYSFFHSIYAQFCLTVIAVIMSLWVSDFFPKLNNINNAVVYGIALTIILNFIRYTIRKNRETGYFKLCLKVLERYKGEIVYSLPKD